MHRTHSYNKMEMLRKCSPNIKLSAGLISTSSNELDYIFNTLTALHKDKVQYFTLCVWLDQQPIKSVALYPTHIFNEENTKTEAQRQDTQHFPERSLVFV